jgi:putative transposase
MHRVWTSPNGDYDFPSRWRVIKATFSQSMPSEGAPTEAMAHRGYRGIWQRGYWEHTIRDDRDCAAHIEYTHFNPVKHGLVASPSEWPFSTFRRWVSCGIYPESWAGEGGREASCDMGERS